MVPLKYLEVFSLVNCFSLLRIFFILANRACMPKRLCVSMCRYNLNIKGIGKELWNLHLVVEEDLHLKLHLM
jgi:hypothetical protein